MAKAAHRLVKCPVCGGRRMTFMFVMEGHRLHRCRYCGTLLLNPQPSDAELRRIYSAGYFLTDGTPADLKRMQEMKRATAKRYLASLLKFSDGRKGRLVEIGSGGGEFLSEAAKAGFESWGVDVSSAACFNARKLVPKARILCGDPATVRLPIGSFDACVLFDALEHMRDPASMIRRARRLLRPQGVLFLSTPDPGSWIARIMGRAWADYKPEHLYYLGRPALRTLLAREGFGGIRFESAVKVLTPAYIARHFERFPKPLFTPLVRFACGLLPNFLGNMPFRVPVSSLNVLARNKTAGI